MYVHLHNHFLIDSSIKIKDALEKIKKDNQPAIAITDHNLVSLHFAFYYECIKQNIKPILGCECYFVDDAESKGAASNKDHIILYAKNIDGLANLYRLIIESRLKYSVSDKASLIDWQLLEKYRDGLIVTNACIYGALANSIVKKSDKYLYRADRFVNLFGDDFFFEIGYHYFPEQLYANEAIIKLAEKYGKTAVLVNDAHHLNKEDWYIQNIIFKRSFNVKNGGNAETQDSYLKTEREMLDMNYDKKHLEETVKLAERIEEFSPEQLFNDKNFQMHNSSETCALSEFVKITAKQAVELSADYFKFDYSKCAELLNSIDDNYSLEQQISANRKLQNFLDDNPLIKITSLKLDGIVYDIKPDYKHLIKKNKFLPVILMNNLLELSQFTIETLPDILKEKILIASEKEKNNLAKFQKLNYAISLYNDEQYEIITNSDELKKLTDDIMIGNLMSYYIANSYYFKNKYAEAIKYYEHLYFENLEIDKKYLALYFYSLILHKLVKDNVKAIKILEEAVKIAPYKPNAYYAFGFIFYNTGDYEKSLENFLKFIECAKKKENAQVMIAKKYIQKINKKLKNQEGMI